MRRKLLRKNEREVAVVFLKLLGLVASVFILTYFLQLSQKIQYCWGEVDCRVWSASGIFYNIASLLTVANVILYRLHYKWEKIFLYSSIILYAIFLIFPLPPGQKTTSNYLEVWYSPGGLIRYSKIKWSTLNKIILLHDYDSNAYRGLNQCTNALYAQLQDGQHIYIGGQVFLMKSVDQGKGYLLDFLVVSKNLPVENHWLNRSIVKDPYYDAKNRCGDLYYYPGKQLFEFWQLF